jgi:hypothetical protein
MPAKGNGEMPAQEWQIASVPQVSHSDTQFGYAMSFAVTCVEPEVKVMLAIVLHP